jgi:hypothetical protein
MKMSFPLVLFVIPACLESFLGRIAGGEGLILMTFMGEDLP